MRIPDISLVFLSAFSILPGTGCHKQQTGDSPNVLFIAVDDLNDWTGAMQGHPLAHTPNLDSLMQSGVYFSNAHCTSPICVSSRNSLLCGLRPSTTGWYDADPNMNESWRDVLKDTVPMPKHFRDNGYITMAAGKIYHTGVADFAPEVLWDATKPPVKIGEPWKSRGDGYDTDMFYPFPAGGSQISRKFGSGTRGQSLCWDALEDEDIPDGQMPDERVAEWAIDQLSRDYDRPFFMAVGFYRPHLPYVVPKKYFEPYDLEDITIPDVPADELSDVPVFGKAMTMGLFPGGDHTAVLELGEQYWRELIRAYLASVTFVDEQIGRVLDALDSSQYARDTIVVLWSDHGQNLGEKFNWRKMCLWETSTRVPLAFRIPGGGFDQGKSLEPVSLLDLYPTLIELCGLPVMDALEGESLVPLLKDLSRESPTPAITTWLYKNHSVRDKRWRYIQYRDGSEELYDHEADPRERNNLADDSRYSGIKHELQTYLPGENVHPLQLDERKPDRLDAALLEFEMNGLPQWMQ